MTEKKNDSWATSTEQRPAGKAISTMFAGPLWMPQHSLFAEKERERLIAKDRERHPGSSATATIVGKVATVMAYGRQVYAIEIEPDLVVKLPEHAPLYSALNMVPLGAKVFVEFKGRADKGRAGQQAPFLYDVVPYEAKDALRKPRADALVIQRRGDPEAPDAEDAPF